MSAKHIIENKFGVKIHPIVNTEDIIKSIESGVISANEYLDDMKEYLRHYKGE